MKILILINNFGMGGAEKLLIESIPQFQEKGITPDVLALTSRDSILYKQLKEVHNGLCFFLSHSGVYSPLFIFKIIPYLKKYDVVHAHLFPALYWLVLAKWMSFSNVKIIYTEHNSTNKRRKSFLFRMIDRIIYRGIDNVITISDEVDDNLRSHLNTSKVPIVKIYNGVDVQKIYEASPYDKGDFFSEKDFILMQVSRFKYPKDQKTLIRAMADLPPSVKLLLVGDGPALTECRLYAKELGVSERVKFLGIRSDIPKLLKTVDVVVLSSHYEGLSLASIEGMASGKPFLASNVPGLREIVTGSGLLFEDKDYSQLVGLIMNIKSDFSLYSDVSKKCVEQSERYNIASMVEQYILVYNRLLLSHIY